ncbi:hypothetical protein KWD88_18635 [Acinetobacter baumannii]
MLAFILYLWFNKSHQITKKSQTSDRRDFYSMSEKIMTEKALIAKLIKNQNRKQTIRHSNSGLVMASVFVLLAFSAFGYFKYLSDDVQKHDEYVRVQVEGAS